MQRAHQLPEAHPKVVGIGEWLLDGLAMERAIRRAASSSARRSRAGIFFGARCQFRGRDAQRARRQLHAVELLRVIEQGSVAAAANRGNNLCDRVIDLRVIGAAAPRNYQRHEPAHRGCAGFENSEFHQAPDYASLTRSIRAPSAESFASSAS